MSQLREIWKPLTIGNVTVKHRIMMPPHGVLHAENNIPNERLVAYYRERAKGGAALVGVNTTSATRHSLGPFANQLTGFEKRSIPAFAELAEAVHEYDCKVFVELASFGVSDRGRMRIDDWHPVWGLSRVPSPIWNEVPALMDRQLIREIVEDFGISAANMRVAGVDGIDLHGAHGYLLHQALSPAYNKRTDDYGGSARKRCRLIIEIAESIRSHVTDELPLGIRLAWDEGIGDAGITPELSEEYLEILAETGLFDFFDISTGGYHTLHLAVPPMGSVEDGFLIPHGKRAKEIVGDRARIFVVGRIRELELAESVINEGAADMVAMLRAQIADPFLIKKGMDGRTDETVRCIGGNECITAVFWSPGGVTCTVNPAVGREQRWGEGTLVPTERAQGIAVVGGGPAGMRVAAVAAERGHDVTLFERESELGGHLRMLSRLPTRGDWRLAIDNLRQPLERLGVDVRQVEVTSELLEAEALGAVVCATGSSWDDTGYSSFRPERDTIPGSDQSSVMDVGAATALALDDPSALGQRVVVLDDSGFYLPLGLAEVLAAAGVTVDVVSRHPTIGEELQQNLEAAIVLPRLVSAGVTLRPQHFVEAIDGDAVEVYGIWGEPPFRLDGVSTVVLSLARTPRDELFHALDQRSQTVHRIGDALAPRKVADAIYDGEKLARQL